MPDGRLLTAFATCFVLAGTLSVTAQTQGPEFLVNTYTTGKQMRPQVAAGGGQFIVIWTAYGVPGAPDIMGQRYDSSGSPLGGEFQVNQDTIGQQFITSIAADSAGNFVVVWTSLSGSGLFGADDSFGLFARRFNANGTPATPDFHVNTHTPSDQLTPSIAMEGSGSFVVSWISRGQDGNYEGVFAQRYFSNAARNGGEFQVNTFTTGSQNYSAVGVQPGGAFEIVWKSDQFPQKLHGQAFDSGGASVGNELPFGSTAAGMGPAIAADNQGAFLVVWDDFSSNVAAQRLSATGALVGSQFQVNTGKNAIGFAAPAIGVDAIGDFTVVWPTGDADGYGVAGQAFAANGLSNGAEFQVNTYTTATQNYPSVARIGGDMLIVWQSPQDGSNFGIMGKHVTIGTLAPTPTFTATPTATNTPTPTGTPTPTTTASPTPTSTLPPVVLSRTEVNFDMTRSGSTLVQVTPPQTVLLSAPGAWTAASDMPAFLEVSPTSGTGPAQLTLRIASTTGLPTSGGIQGHVTVTGVGASGLPPRIYVIAEVLTQLGPPFGFFDTPVNNATGVAGAIAVTGWTMDDIGVTSVKIYRDPVSADAPGVIGTNGKVYVADANFVYGARTDIQSQYGGWPFNDRAAWGNMVLTNFLPSGANPVGGNGVFTLYAYATDVEGNTVLLGSKTITVDNQNATKPFGTIDTPLQGGMTSGLLDNFGWALTPGTATIPTDGSTIQVFVDGTFRGTAWYNLPRTDIQTLFPGYTNTNGAIGYFQIDTTTLTNGVHTIFWIVTDDQARADGIGSRFFTVLN